ncbi:Siderophore synthetase component [Halobacillus alkaliphilus]|uniref:Siderophore synthetase component n=1 Tax=Halobacillus alkaliphilus TaxID=396056 RepID=A0A1I2M2P0_9BACI|nr:IucA/IucC family protein [Halobacillus alkaliphilus]SFF83571.1 Siderophore synthetase component [Halobacillus alkaliphilus]
MTLPLPKIRKDGKVQSLIEEQSCLRFLYEKKPEYAPYFLAHMEKGRKGILHKLADSILREDISGYYSSAIDLKKQGSTLFINGKPHSWEGVYKQLQFFPLQEEVVYKFVPLNRYAVLFPVQREYSFHLVETSGDIIYLDKCGTRIVSAASELIRLMFTTEEYPNRDAFIKELDNGTANLTLAYMYNERWKTAIKQEASEFQAATTLEYLKEKQKRTLGFSKSLFFEQLVVEGHHLHPGAKTKLGLSFEDVFQYSGEFHQSFEVCFAAVRREYLRTTSEKGSTLKEFFPVKWQDAVKELNRRGHRAEEFDVLPVHPWQFVHAVPFIYKEEIHREDIILLEDAKLNAQATSSFRTVAPLESEVPVMKLAVNSQMTSTVRSISTQTAMNSTVFSSLIEKIMEQEGHLDGFVPLHELAGAAFRSEDQLKSRNLTMLIRENIDVKLEKGEAAIAGMALYAESPVTETTVLKELAEELRVEESLTEAQAAADFFNDYIQTVIPAYVTLMVKYGVALEGHLQNSIPVFKNGRLTRFFFRDWGGSRIYKERIQKQNLNPSFAAGSVSVTSELSEMHNKLYYTVFQNHLGEMIRQLVQYSGQEEKYFWKQVKLTCEKTFESLGEDPKLREAVREDRAFLYQPAVMHKSLTKMRLTDSKGYGYNQVPNPLAD